MNGYQLSLQAINSMHLFLPQTVTPTFVSQIALGEKKPLKITNVWNMQECVKAYDFINAEAIFAALINDPCFAIRLPDKFSFGMRSYVLDIINTFTASEYEGILQRL